MFTSLRVVVDLLREQNALLRELIHILTQRPVVTKTTAPNLSSRTYTASDVFVQTRSSLAIQQAETKSKISAPWRDDGPTPSKPKTSSTSDEP